MAQQYSARPDVQDALESLIKRQDESMFPALKILQNYILTLEQQARNVVQDADDDNSKYSGAGRVTWQSLNAIRATINFPRR